MTWIVGYGDDAPSTSYAIYERGSGLLLTMGQDDMEDALVEAVEAIGVGVEPTIERPLPWLSLVRYDVDGEVREFQIVEGDRGEQPWV